MPAAKGLSPARKLALQVLVRVQRDNAFAERVLHTGFARLDLSEQDRAFCTELVFGTLRWRILLDNLLNGFLKKPLRKLPAQVQNTLRMGAYQCSFLRTPAYSAVDQALRLIGREHPAHKGLVNAVLRKFDENTPEEFRATKTYQNWKVPERLSHDYALPLWLIEELQNTLDEDGLLAWLRVTKENKGIHLRINSMETSVDELVAKFQQANMRCEPHPNVPSALVVHQGGSPEYWPGFSDGEFMVQDVAAQWIGQCAAPAPGDTVIDCCAAPGGKTTHLAEKMQNDGKIYAVDIHPGRLNKIKENTERLCLDIVEPLVLDLSDPGAIEKSALGALQGKADLIVLDAPCSALGTINKNPEIALREAPDWQRLARLQRTLLENMAPYLRINGTLVYSVCTFTAAEGPETIEHFLKANPNFSVEEEVLDHMAQEHAPKNVQSRVKDGLNLWTHILGGDSFFLTRLKRNA